MTSNPCYFPLSAIRDLHKSVACSSEMGRAPCCEKEGLKRGRWTAEEDKKLLKYVAENGEGSWRSLPKNAGLLRCGKSCRLRWLNYLRADLRRGNISKEEEEIIIKLHSTIGNRWSLIAAQLPGRTDNEIKNYWNTHLSRRVQCFRRIADGETVILDLGNITRRRKRHAGRTSRAAMKKNHAAPTSVSGSNTASSFFVEAAQIIDQTADKKEENSGEVAGDQGMAEVEKVLEWDLESLEAKLWEDETSENWPCMWDESGDSDFVDQSIFSWLLSS